MSKKLSKEGEVLSSVQKSSNENENLGLLNDNEFKIWVLQLKKDIRSAQVKASIHVNSEMLRLYWRIGAEICEKQKNVKWGSGWLKELSRVLMSEFPNMKGFSHRNLKYIRQWYLFYNENVAFGQQLVAQISDEVFFSVPWGHHLYVLTKCKDVKKAFFYLSKTVEHGWSRSVLLNFLDTNLYETEGNSINNFSKLLPNPQSDLANQIIKDPYNFQFLTLENEYREKELEDALTENITKFLLELGVGFAYVGRQIPLNVGDETIYPDLLFYHLELRCYVVVELKVSKFKSEHLGQLCLYVSAVNHIKKKDIDNPTTGLLICKTKNNVMAQYALESTNQPIGISEYQLSKLIPKDIKSQLPTVEDIEASLFDNNF
jgi:predicted nuclease of restriction endonuclease-like (RecB) superfamily